MSGAPRPHPGTCLLLKLDADWWKGGGNRALRCVRVHRKQWESWALALKVLLGVFFLSGKQLENLALLHRTPTSICKLVKRNKFLSCGFIKINYFHLLTLFTLPYSPNLFKIKQDKLESKGIQYTI